MRKRISCKVIRSVTLGKTDRGLQCASGSNARRPGTAGAASFTYTSRLVVTRTDIEDGFGARTLDLCA